MFVVIISFPAIKEGQDSEFKKWFTMSGAMFSKSPGFISRRLLKPIKGGNYAAIVEFENQVLFQAMHSSPEHAQAAAQVMPLFDGNPQPTFYQVVEK